MFQALPQRHSKPLQNNAEAFATSFAKPTNQHLQSFEAQLAPVSSQPAHTRAKDASSRSARDSFRLSFSPTGIPCVVSASDQQAEDHSDKAKTSLARSQQGDSTVHGVEVATAVKHASQLDAPCAQLPLSGSLDLAVPDLPSAGKASSQPQPEADEDILPTDILGDVTPSAASLGGSTLRKEETQAFAGLSSHSDASAAHMDIAQPLANPSKSQDANASLSDKMRQAEKPTAKSADSESLQQEQSPPSASHDTPSSAVNLDSSSTSSIEPAVAADMSGSKTSASTPTLAWLRALGGPGFALLPELTPLTSSSQQSLPHQATPPHSAAAAATTTPPATERHEPVAASRSAATSMTASAETDAMLSQAPLHAQPQQVRPESLTAQRVSGSEKVAPPQQTPLQAQPQKALAALLNCSSSQRRSEARKGRLAQAQAGTAQVTPTLGLKQATPGTGPLTGFSGLTTPASAAEMHRYCSGVDLYMQKMTQ